MTVIYELETNDISKILAKYNDISKILAKYFGTDPKNVKVMVSHHYLYDNDSYQVARAEVKLDTELEIDETE